MHYITRNLFKNSMFRDNLWGRLMTPTSSPFFIATGKEWKYCPDNKKFIFWKPEWRSLEKKKGRSEYKDFFLLFWGSIDSFQIIPFHSFLLFCYFTLSMIWKTAAVYFCLSSSLWLYSYFSTHTRLPHTVFLFHFLLDKKK